MICKITLAAYKSNNYQIWESLCSKFSGIEAVRASGWEGHAVVLVFKTLPLTVVLLL